MKGKKRVIKSGVIIGLLILVVFMTGCSGENDQEPEIDIEAGFLGDMEDSEVLATVNDVDITVEDVRMELENRYFQKRMVEEIGKVTDDPFVSPKDQFLRILEKNESELDDSEQRYYDRLARRDLTVIPSVTEAFNEVLRKEILYYEAGYHRAPMTEEEMLQAIEEGEASMEARIEMMDEDEAEEFAELKELQDEIAREFGYDSFFDRQESNLGLIAKSTTVSRFKADFEQDMLRRDFDKSQFALTIHVENLWEDYGEFLMEKAEIENLHEELEIIYYGEEWDLSF